MNEKEYFDLVKKEAKNANKSLGQNFLVDRCLCENIINILGIGKDDNVYEIGSGLGSLSYFLSKSDASITLSDIDDKMLDFLNQNIEIKPNIKIIHQNILKADLLPYTKLIGNLPYYITSGSIEYLALNAINAQKIVLMTQKEVFYKLFGDKKEISPLSILLNYIYKFNKEYDVDKSAFIPAPHVDSIVFSLERVNETTKEVKETFKLMKKMFINRRKTLANNLSSIVKDKNLCNEILNKLGLSLTIRPEQLTIIQYFSLIKELYSLKVSIK